MTASGHRAIVHFMAVSLFMLSGCDRSEWTMPKMERNLQTTIASDADKAAPNWQAQRTAYLDSAREEIDLMQQKIDALEVKARNATSELRVAMDVQLQDLRDQLAAIRHDWEAAKSATEATWHGLKEKLNHARQRLRRSLDNASA